MSSPASPGDWPDPSSRPTQPEPHLPSPPPAAPSYPDTGYRAVPSPPGYGHPPAPGFGGYPRPPTNGLAIASMVTSIAAAASLLCGLCFSLLGLITMAGGVVGLVLGIVARRQIAERGQEGSGMALAGIITGAIAAALGLLFVVFSLLLGLYAFGAGGLSW